MSQQIQITGGAKVRNLEGVLTGTSGVVNSLGINVPSGIPQLDASGKILVSQLPNSVMEYKGTWNAATNTPTLADGTGNQGDVYLCNVAGTVNFGSGPIAFFVGDQVIYSGTIWQRASGATGTVTSVAVTESGDSLNITGSPITTSGTINIGFNGDNTQYINGAGNLTTFPSLAGYVPYTGATTNVNLGTFDLSADAILGATGSFISNGSANTFDIEHSSGSGIALSIVKEGNNEGLYVEKTSGSGNAATIIGTLNATTLVKSGGTSSQFLKADGSIDSSTYLTTSAAASTYVPYTGATANVDLGTYSLTAAGVTANSFNAIGSGVQGGYIYLKQGSTPYGALVGANGISADGTKYILISDVGSSNYKLASLELGSLTNNTNRTFTLPDITGTLALLEGTQTFSGNKTFSVAPRNDGGIILKEGVIPSADGYTGLAGDADGLVITKRVSSTAYTNLLYFNSATSNTYTFPNATGTIALLSGTQTFTGTTTFNFPVTAPSFVAKGSTSTVEFLNSADTTLKHLIFAESYSATVPANNVLKFQVANQANGVATPLTLYGSGAATFSSSVTAGSEFISYSGITMDAGGGLIRGGLTINYSTGEFKSFCGVAGNLYFQTFNTNGSERMRITSGGDVAIGTTTALLTASGRGNLTINGSSQSILTFGIAGAYSGYVFAGSSNFEIDAQGSRYMQFNTNGQERMRITSGGYLKASNDGTYNNANGIYHELRTSQNSAGVAIRATNASYSDSVVSVEADRNTTNNTFYALQYYNYGTGTYRFRVADSGNVTNTNNSYGAISDVKLKENITDATPKLDDLLKVQIKNFNYIGSEEKQLGVIAQELEQVFPSMIQQHEDIEDVKTIDEDGNLITEKKSLGTITKSVKYSVFVPMLIKSTQEIVEKYDSKIAILEAQIEQLKALIAAK